MDFVLVLGMSINHIVYREGKNLQDLIDHYEQKKKEIIKNRGKLGFKSHWTKKYNPSSLIIKGRALNLLHYLNYVSGANIIST